MTHVPHGPNCENYATACRNCLNDFYKWKEQKPDSPKPEPNHEPRHHENWIGE